MVEVKILDKHNKTICKAVVSDEHEDYKEASLEFKGKSGWQEIKVADLIGQISNGIEQKKLNNY